MALGSTQPLTEMSRKVKQSRYRPEFELRCLLLSPALRSNAGMANRQGDVDLRFAQVDVPS